MKYKTGQPVRLVLGNGKNTSLGTAIDARDKSGIYVGVIFAGVGLVAMLIGRAALSVLSIGLLAIVATALSLIVKKVRSLQVDFSEQGGMDRISFDPDNVLPIDEMAERRGLER